MLLGGGTACSVEDVGGMDDDMTGGSNEMDLSFVEKA